MSVFGSRNDDPLLQNDPLAPPSDENEEEDAPSPDDSTTEDDAASHPEEASRESSASNGERTEESVFGPSVPVEGGDEDGQHSRTGTEKTRVVVCSVAGVARETIANLNEALDDGWRLDHVEVNERGRAEWEEEGEDSSADSSLELAFVLRRSAAE